MSKQVPICSNHEIYFGGKSGKCTLCEQADRITELEAQVEGLKKICFDYSLTGFDVEIQTAIDALTSPCQSHDQPPQSAE